MLSLNAAEKMADALESLPAAEQRSFMRAFVGVHAAFWLVCLGGGAAIFHAAQPVEPKIIDQPTAAIPTAPAPSIPKP